MTKRRCGQTTVPFLSAIWPRQRLMPRPVPLRDRGCKVGARQRTGQPRARQVRGRRRLAAVRSTAMSAAGGPLLPSYLPVSHALLHGNVPRDCPHGLSLRRAASRPSGVARPHARRRTPSSSPPCAAAVSWARTSRMAVHHLAGWY